MTLKHFKKLFLRLVMKHPKVEYRIEKGPRRVTAVATPELLSDLVTAHHYQVGAFDAWGKKIALGEPMTYLDYFGKKVFYLYKYDKGVGKWLPAGEADTEEEILSKAEEIE